MKRALSDAAARDLDAIYDYSAERWGSDQASTYVASFQAAFDQIGERPSIGPLSNAPDGYRRLRHRHHHIFYRVETDRVRIERVLHERMDAVRHLR